MDIAFDIAAQPDGKLIAGGFTDFGSIGHAASIPQARDFAVVRYNPDGTLDTDFGGDGIVTTDVSARRDELRAVAVQPDAKVVVAGLATTSAGREFGVVRYLPDGLRDPSFGIAGLVTTDHGGPGTADFAAAMALQPDGRMVVAGASGSASALARYNHDGSLDTSFDGDGLVATSFGSSISEFISGVVIQPDGRIVVSAQSSAPAPCGDDCVDWHVGRYNSDGSLDTSFDGDGMVTTDFGPGSERAAAVVIQPADGKIVAAGDIGAGGTAGEAFALARYHADGSLDTRFGAGGTVSTDAPVDLGRGTDLAVQADGRIVVAGNGGADFAVVRYDPDGSLDASFSGDGLAAGGFSGANLNGVALQPDGDIAATGTALVGGGFDFALAIFDAGLCPGLTIDNTIVGTAGDETLTGTAGRDLILGLAGNDEIRGGDGGDCIVGGGGDDLLVGDGGGDRILGDTGDDTINAGRGDDTIVGGLGQDSILAKTGNDKVLVAAGDVPDGQTEAIHGGISPGSDTVRLGKKIGPVDVVGTPLRFHVVDPVTGGRYAVSDVETIKDPP